MSIVENLCCTDLKLWVSIWAKNARLRKCKCWQTTLFACFCCGFAFFFLYFLLLVTEKVVLASKNWFQTGNGIAEHPFAGQNTQHSPIILPIEPSLIAFFGLLYINHIVVFILTGQTCLFWPSLLQLLPGNCWALAKSDRGRV